MHTVECFLMKTLNLGNSSKQKPQIMQKNPHNI